MALLHIPLDDITEEHLRGLIENEAAESLYIDYKRQSYGGKDGDKKEFLADISSFANAAGGDIVIGMEATKEGIPKGICPLQDNLDAEILRLQQMSRANIEPPLIDLRIRSVAVEGSHVLIIRIPKSYNPPHAVMDGTRRSFHGRSSRGKNELNVEELRHLFLAAPHLAERIRAFRMERIARIAAGETPVPLSSETRRRYVLHIVPLSAFNPTPVVSFADVVKRAAHGFHPNAELGYDIVSRVNFDGQIAFVQDRVYTQVFRSGIVECVYALQDAELTYELRQDSNRAFYPYVTFMEERCQGLALRYAATLTACGIAPPYAILVSLLGMNGAKFRGYWRGACLQCDVYSADRDQYHFTPSVFETLPRNPDEAIVMLEATFNQMASLVGRSGSNYVLEAQVRLDRKSSE